MSLPTQFQSTRLARGDVLVREYDPPLRASGTPYSGLSPKTKKVYFEIGEVSNRIYGRTRQGVVAIDTQAGDQRRSILLWELSDVPRFVKRSSRAGRTLNWLTYDSSSVLRDTVEANSPMEL
ncbi:hypothetical protein BC827DRAFT_1155869 [Russula dissimulans]|nr:hypothetical protein BC827DRAFT_1155869 [Russula dissimulans]